MVERWVEKFIDWVLTSYSELHKIVSNKFSKGNKLMQVREVSALQGGFYTNGKRTIRVDSVTFCNVRFTDKRFGDLKSMSWEEFGGFNIINDVQTWGDFYRKNNLG